MSSTKKICKCCANIRVVEYEVKRLKKNKKIKWNWAN